MMYDRRLPQRALSACCHLLLLVWIAPGGAQDQFGSFSKVGGFTTEIASEYGPLEGFCYGDDHLYGLTWEGYLVKIDTTGNILWTKHTGIGSTLSGFYGAICFDQDTLWVVKSGRIYALDTVGNRLGVTIDFGHLGEPYLGDIGGMIKDSDTFWLIEKWMPILFQISRDGNLIKHYATSWLDFWSPTIGSWGNKILKITDSTPPSNIFNNLGVLALDRGTGAIIDIWEVPRDFTGGMYLGISKGRDNLWAAQFYTLERLLSVHRLLLPEPSPPPELPTTTWGDFEIIDWAYCPITPAMIEGLYGFGFDQASRTFWFGNGIYDVVGARETDGRYLSISHFSRTSRKYDFAAHNDTLWGVHYWAALTSAVVSQVTFDADSMVVHAVWETGLEQAHGLATNGTHIWVSGRDTVLTTGDRNNHIVKFDRAGNRVAHFIYPDDNEHNYEDLAWHQNGLWAVTRSKPFGKDVIIQRLDLDTGVILESFDTGWMEPEEHLWANLASDGASLVTIGVTASGVFDHFEKQHVRILKLQPITVSPPVADFAASPRSGARPLPVQFTDLSTGEIDTWIWGFGDGNTSRDHSPAHTYELAGSFSISLTVSGPGGADTATQTDYIVVEDEPTAVVQVGAIPSEYRLYQNYPNPFNPETTIAFDMPRDSETRITILNVNGQLVAELFKGRRQAGSHTVVWKAPGYPTGIYFIKLVAGDFVQSRKCLLLK